MFAQPEPTAGLLQDIVVSMGMPAGATPAAGRADFTGDGAVTIGDLWRFLDLLGPRSTGGSGVGAGDPGAGVGPTPPIPSLTDIWSGGAEWTGEAVTPAAPIARWVTTPFQCVEGMIRLGLVAFDTTGIERVEFRVPGGPSIVSRQMRQNADTGVWEYGIDLHASWLADGVVDIDARVVAKSGVVRTMPPLRLLMNAREGVPARECWVSPTGSDATGDGSPTAPFASIWRAAQWLGQTGPGGAADNATVWLRPGSYRWGRPGGSETATTQSAWLTVSAAPGVSAAEVEIVPGGADLAGMGGLNTKLVRLRGLTIRGGIESNSAIESHLWVDGCVISGTGPGDTTIFWASSWWTSVWATDSIARHVVNGFPTVALARGCLVDTFYNDAFPGALCVVNSEARNGVGGVTTAGYSYHSDIWQDRPPFTDDGVILYGVVGRVGCTKTSGVFSRSRSIKNVAIVNCSFDLRGYPTSSEWRTRTEHMVMLYNTFLGSPLTLGLTDRSWATGVSGFLASRNVLVKGNVFQWVGLDDPLRVTTPSGYPSAAWLGAGVVFERNHFLNVWPDWQPGVGGTPVWLGRLLGTMATSGPSVPAGVGAYGSAAPPFADGNMLR